jgi:hypothetical protein
LASLGGFASKLGLASRSMVAAFMLSDDNYELVIYLVTGVLVAAAGMVTMPVRLPDKN